MTEDLLAFRRGGMKVGKGKAGEGRTGERRLWVGVSFTGNKCTDQFSWDSS